MKRKLLFLVAACALLLPLACDSDTVVDPSMVRYSSSNGLHLRDTDAGRAMPADTTVVSGDIIRMALAAGSGNGPQNNRNVVWTTSNAAVVSIVPTNGTVVAVALATGTSVVSAKLGGVTTSVTIHVGPPGGPGVAYVVTASSATPTAGSAVTISAQLVDGSNNPVAQAGRVVTWSSTNGGSFMPSISLTNGSGVASTSFTVSTTAGVSHVVTATDNLAATGSSGAIVTQTGPAANMVAHAGDGQSATVGTAVAVPPAVRVTDANGNPVSGIAVVFAVASGGGSVTAPNATTDANGVAAVGSWTLGSTPGSNTLDASSAGLPTVTFTATATAGAATQLAVQTQPAPTVQAGVVFPQQPAIQLRDGFNNDVAQAGVVVTAAIATGAGTLAGTLTATTDAAGLATFTDLRIDGATGTRTLAFSATGLAGATSDPVNVIAGPAAAIVLSTPATTVLTGSTVTITGQLQDAFANPVPQVVAVSWSSTNGGSFSANPTSTNGSGQTTVDFTVSATSGVTHVVTATAGAASGTISITTINNAPLANNDSFDAIGNVTVPVPAPGVLANDSDPDAQPVSAVPGTFATVNGGSVTINADGSFSYLSAPGFNGVDQVTYTITDGSLTASATLQLTVTRRFWYVDNSAAAPGDGRDASPFTTLAAAQVAAFANDTIFVMYGDGTSSGMNAGITLQAGQGLIGQGIPAAITTTVNGNALTLLAANGTPTIARVTGPTVQLASDNVVRGLALQGGASSAPLFGSSVGNLLVSDLSIDAVGGAAMLLGNGTVAVTVATANAAGAPVGIGLSSIDGTVSVAGGTISATTSDAVSVSGGSASVTYGGSISVTTGRPLHATNMTGGGVSLTGNVTSSGLGMHVANNSGSTFAFSGAAKSLTTGASPAVTLATNPGSTIAFSGGGLTISTTSGAGFTASGGGTVSVTGAGNTITSAGGVALTVTSTTIDAAGLTFERISATGGTQGIVLDGTGALGGLEVTGDGASSTTNTTRGRTTAKNGGGIIVLGSGGTITGTTGAAVQLTNAAQVVLRNMDIINNSAGVTASGVTGLTIDNTRITGHASQSGVAMTGGSGVAFIHAEVASNGTALSTVSNVLLSNVGGVGSVQHSTFHSGRQASFEVRGTSATFSISADNSNFNTASGGHGFAVNAVTSANLSASISGSSLLGNFSRGFSYTGNDASGGGTITLAGNVFDQNNTEIAIAHQGLGQTVTIDVQDNLMRQTFLAGSSAALSVLLGSASSSTSVLRGTIAGNTIGAAAVPNSGSHLGIGIGVESRGAGTLTVLVDDNIVRQVGQDAAFFGKLGENTVSTSRLNLTLSRNDFSVNTANPSGYVAVDLAMGVLAGDQGAACINIDPNNVRFEGSPFFTHTLLQTAGSIVTNLFGYAGAANNAAQIETFLDGRAAVTTPQPALTALGGGTVQGTVTACPTS